MSMRSLTFDSEFYAEAFQAFLDNSTEHQNMVEFFQNKLPDEISSIGSGKSTLNILSIGGGAGQMDLQILKQFQAKYPGAVIHNDVVEPNTKHISFYQERVAKTSGLENIKFTWHKETSMEFERRMKASKEVKKWHFIHMIQMLYYVEDRSATIRYFYTLLEPGAKLLMILVSGTGGWARIWKECGSRFCKENIPLLATASDVDEILNEAGLKYQSYQIPSQLDITDCFVEGNKNGELILDFLTMTHNFGKTAPPDLKSDIIEVLKSPECSEMRGGRYMFNNNDCAIMIQA